MADLFDLSGLAPMQQRLQQIGAETLPLLGIALQQEADAVRAASQPLVPVDTGLLRSTGETDGPFLTGASASVQIRYGGHGAAPYAALVHEDTTMRHPRGGQSHFLSQPLFEATDGMLERLADALRVGL